MPLRSHAGPVLVLLLTLGALPFPGPVQPAEGLPGGGAGLPEAGPGPGLPGGVLVGGRSALADPTAEAALSFGAETGFRVLTRAVREP